MNLFRVLIMPQVFPVTSQTMNYAGPIMAGVCGLSWIWYKLYWVSVCLCISALRSDIILR